jgi:RNase P/RNase MRP subunit p29
MWKPSETALTNWTAGPVVVKEILYAYDGPAIFTANIGLTLFLFYKIDEGEQSDIFLITGTTDDIVGALRSGQLSLLGALARGPYWIVDLASKLEVRRCWSVDAKQLPPDIFPASGLGLYPLESPAPDTIEQAFSFFSVRFVSPDLGAESVPLSRFKYLVDNAYDSIRRIFPPPEIEEGTVVRGFDFNILQPKFGSLIIAVQDPFVDRLSLRKELREKIDDQEILKSFEENRRHFFEGVNEVVKKAEKGELKRGFASQHFETLYQINELLPTEDNSIRQVELRSRSNPVVSIDDKIGGRLRHGFRLAESTDRNLTGVIVEVNAESATFVLKDRYQRQTTCLLKHDIFSELDLRVGVKVRVNGAFTRRRRRDKINVEGYPEFID